MKRIFALAILAATLGTALSGCIVVPTAAITPLPLPRPLLIAARAEPLQAIRN